jgi:hypothetical protein
MRLCREEGYQALPWQEALRYFDAMDRWSSPRLSARLREFAADARLARRPLSEMGDIDLQKLVRQQIRDRDLVALRKGNDVTATSATVEQRRLVRRIAQQTKGRLSNGGRQYKLVPDVELDKLPGRNNYEVVGQDDARRVLDDLAKQATGDLATLFAQASAKLSPDWRKPVSWPDGLILLRRSPVFAAAGSNHEPAMTPSQIKALMEEANKNELVLKLERLYHDDHPVQDAPFTVELSDGSKIEGQLDAKGRATVPVPSPPTRVQFGPDQRPWKSVDQEKNPDFQADLGDIDAFVNARLGS